MNARDDFFCLGEGEKVDTPPRTELFRPEPLGVGTAHQESLLSYLVRVSHAHGVNPRLLVKYVLAEHTPRIAQIATKAFFQTLSGTINGLSSYAETFADVFCALTLRPELRQLTMLPWKGLFPHNGQGLLARRPRWCPICLNEDGQGIQGTPIPLAWALEPYRVCVTHGVRLEDRCHVCGAKQNFLPSYPDPGYCRHCRSWLGHQARPQDVSDFHVWVARAIVDIIASGSNQSVDLSLDVFRRFLVEQISRQTGGNRTAFCRAVGLGDFAVSGWINKQQRPSLVQFLTLCRGLQVLPTEVFAECPAESGPAYRHTPSARLLDREPCPRPPFARRQAWKQFIEAELASGSPRCVNQLAKSLGVSSTCLRYWFPVLCKALSDQSRKAARERSSLRQRKEVAVLEDIVAATRLNGGVVSRRKVDQLLREKGLTISRPHLRKALNGMPELMKASSA